MARLTGAWLGMYGWGVFCWLGAYRPHLAKAWLHLQALWLCFVLFCFSSCRCSCLRAGMEYGWDEYVAEAWWYEGYL
jgi:hypothetical protein